MKGRVTPENITKLDSTEIFVFGSNTMGWHGKGAALFAMSWGAVKGRGEGRMGQCYAIPIKKPAGVENRLQTMSVETIRPCVRRFIQYASLYPFCTFLVTEIGCGLAGYRPKQIAPLFGRASALPTNIHLPQSFWDNLVPELEGVC